MLLKFLSSRRNLVLFDPDSNVEDCTDLCFKLLPAEGGMVVYGGFCLELYVRGEEHRVWPSRNHQDTDPLSMDTIGIAKKWLKDCIENHPGCRIRFDRDFLPSRLIDVGLQDQNGYFSMPHIIETKESLSHSDLRRNKWQYATLSHCWGKSIHLTTKTETINERKTAIPISSMNKTFADAIHATRKLEIRYLWIDSLCIIQDSNEDWNKQAPKMCFVYNNAILNIAAVGATDGDDGFLLERLAVKVGHVLRPDGNMARSLWIRPCIRNGSCNWQHDVKASVCPLFRRAWVLQESILAARTLAYCPAGMHFRCRAGQMSDDDPVKNIEQDLSIFSGTEHVIFPIIMLKTAVLRQTIYFDYAMDVWYRLLATYSAKEILLKKDKLPAVAGLAFQIGSITGDVYLAGLWQRNFPEALCWIPRRRTGDLCNCAICNPEQSSVYTAPSWSWASISVPFNYCSNAFTSGRGGLLSKASDIDSDCPTEPASFLWDAMLIEASIDYVSDSYGQVKGGFIIIRGHLLKIDYLKPVGASHIEYRAVSKGLEMGNFTLDPRTFDKRLKHWALLLGYENLKEERESERARRLGVEFKNGNGYPMKGRICTGLILVEMEDGVFERVAYFEQFRAMWPSETTEFIIR